MHKIIILLVALLAATAHAQTDFTKQYVDNPAFTVTIIDKEQLQKSDSIEVNGLSIKGAYTKMIKEVEYIYTTNEKEGKALLKAAKKYLKKNGSEFFAEGSEDGANVEIYQKQLDATTWRTAFVSDKAVEGQYAVAFLIGANIFDPSPAYLLDLPDFFDPDDDSDE